MKWLSVWPLSCVVVLSVLIIIARNLSMDSSSMHSHQTLHATNHEAISPELSVANAQFLRHLTLCIGVQKGGTSSLQKTLRETADIYAPQSEAHYFDWNLVRQPHGMDSFDDAIRSFYTYGLSQVGYIEHLKLYTKNTSKPLLFAKTPSNILYPHAAYLVSKLAVTQGTKLILLLRDPSARFVSSYFHEAQH